MVLLRVLNHLARTEGWKLHVAHLNHSLRGRSSDADERLVRATARKSGVGATVETADVRAFAKDRNVSIEMAARQLRHEFLARVARKQKTQTIALAHHADDQVELFFLRLLRGSGGTGLSGMDWSGRSPVDPNVMLVRPLLDCSKEELIAYAQQEKVRFREDRTNEGLDILRNRIRHELIPLLEKHYQPAIRKTTLRLMEVLRAESAVLNACIEVGAQAGLDAADELTPHPGPLPVERRGRRSPGFATRPVALQRRLLQNELIRVGLIPKFDLIEDLRKLEATPVMIEARTVVKRDSQGRLSVERLADNSFQTGRLVVSLSADEGSFEMEGLRVEWCIKPITRRAGLGHKPNAGVESFDADKIGPSIVMRHWQPGDRIQPIGMPQSVKLQDFFVNQKIPREDRHKLLIAASAAGEVVWVEGLRISERFKLDKGSTRRLKWAWRRK